MIDDDPVGLLTIRSTQLDAAESRITPGRRTDLWVVVEVAEAYIHCRKHLPRLVPTDQRRSWGTDDPGRKGGDHFGVAASRNPTRGSGRRPGRAPSGG